MRTRTLVFGVGIFVTLVLAYSIVAEVYFDDCGLSQAQAKKVVLEHLDRFNLDAKYLKAPVTQKVSCSYSFDFEGQGQKLNYVVISTWIHGVKLTSWDYQREAAEDAHAALHRQGDEAGERR